MERREIEGIRAEALFVGRNYGDPLPKFGVAVIDVCNYALSLECEKAELEERLRKATALVEIKTAAGKDLFDLLEECEIKLRKAEEALKGLKEEL